MARYVIRYKVALHLFQKDNVFFNLPSDDITTSKKSPLIELITLERSTLSDGDKLIGPSALD